MQKQWCWEWNAYLTPEQRTRLKHASRDLQDAKSDLEESVSRHGEYSTDAERDSARVAEYRERLDCLKELCLPQVYM